eukprot:8287866-Pyramimonas_sp.AAC.1
MPPVFFTFSRVPRLARLDTLDRRFPSRDTDPSDPLLGGSPPSFRRGDGRGRQPQRQRHLRGDP